MFCTKCGQENDDNAYRCTQCGNILHDLKQFHASERIEVSTYLAQAILVTLFCCLPFGIPAIVFAAQVNGKLESGDYTGAIEKSRQAKTWCWVSFLVGLGSMILYFLFIIIVGIANS